MCKDAKHCSIFHFFQNGCKIATYIKGTTNHCQGQSSPLCLVAEGNGQNTAKWFGLCKYVFTKLCSVFPEVFPVYKSDNITDQQNRWRNEIISPLNKWVSNDTVSLHFDMTLCEKLWHSSVVMQRLKEKQTQMHMEVSVYVYMYVCGCRCSWEDRTYASVNCSLEILVHKTTAFLALSSPYVQNVRYSCLHFSCKSCSRSSEQILPNPPK